MKLNNYIDNIISFGLCCAIMVIRTAHSVIQTDASSNLKRDHLMN